MYKLTLTLTIVAIALGIYFKGCQKPPEESVKDEVISAPLAEEPETEAQQNDRHHRLTKTKSSSSRRHR